MHFSAVLISHCLWSIFLTSETLASDQCWAEKMPTFISFRLLFFCFGFSSSSLPSFSFSSSLVLAAGCEERKYLKYDELFYYVGKLKRSDHRDIYTYIYLYIYIDIYTYEIVWHLGSRGPLLWNQTIIFKEIEWFYALLLRGCSTMAFKPHVRPSWFISSQRALNLPDIS